jgi:hypothetical protein
MSRIMWFVTALVIVVATVIDVVGKRQGSFWGGASLSEGWERRRVLMMQVTALREARNEALVVREGTHAIARLRVLTAKADSSGIVVADGVTPAAAAVVRAQAGRELSALGLEASTLRLFITADQPPSGAPTTLRSKAPLDVIQLLSDFTGDSGCVSVIQLRRREPRELDLVRSTSLTGVCAFVARFGAPGRAVRAWMDTVAFSFAGVAAWNERSDLRPRLQSVLFGTSVGPEDLPRPRHERREAGALGAGCLMGSDTDCRLLLGLTRDAALAVVPGSATGSGMARFYQTVPRLGQRTGWVRATLGTAGGQRLGSDERLFFSDLVYDFGVERFGRFWTSVAPPEAAFVEAFDESLSAYTRRWLARRYDDAPGGPRVPLASGLAAFGLVTLSLGWSARRKRRG